MTNHSSLRAARRLLGKLSWPSLSPLLMVGTIRSRRGCRDGDFGFGPRVLRLCAVVFRPRWSPDSQPDCMLSRFGVKSCRHYLPIEDHCAAWQGCSCLAVSHAQLPHDFRGYPLCELWSVRSLRRISVASGLTARFVLCLPSTSPLNRGRAKCWPVADRKLDVYNTVCDVPRPRTHPRSH